MASNHCQRCKGEFASLNAFDTHLYQKRIDRGTPPYCRGEEQGEPFIDPHLTDLRARAAQMRSLGKGSAARKRSGGKKVRGERVEA